MAYQNDFASEQARRQRAAARARRKKRIMRNRILFGLICLLLVSLIGVGVWYGLKALKDTKKDPVPPGSSASISTSQPAGSPASEPASEPDSTPASTPEGDDWLLTLINNNVPLPEGWNVETEVAEASTQKELATVASAAYKEMKAAAAAEGVDLLLCSGYRSVEYQEGLFAKQKQKWLDKGYTEEQAYNEAKTVVAVPGYSEHNSGLAADIVTTKHQTMDDAFATTDAGIWLAANAPNYGFILRYPENKQAITGIIYEPWHFRYVGVENAKAITASGKCLEEYLDPNA